MQKIIGIILGISFAFSLLVCFYKLAGDKFGITLPFLTTPAIESKAISDKNARLQLAKASTDNNTSIKHKDSRIGG